MRGARVGAVEVLADPSAQIDRRADVEHLVGGPAEQVDAGPVRQRGGENPLAPLLRCHVGQIRPQVGVGVHALVADPLDQPVQHVDGGPGVVERPVRRRRRRTEQPGQRRELARWAPRRG